jgi:hypothetical protein
MRNATRTVFLTLFLPQMSHTVLDELLPILLCAVECASWLTHLTSDHAPLDHWLAPKQWKVNQAALVVNFQTFDFVLQAESRGLHGEEMHE